MAGLKGKSGPPGNMNAFKHGLAAIQKRREESITTEHEEGVRQQILDGLIADKGGGRADIDGHQDWPRLSPVTPLDLMFLNGAIYFTSSTNDFFII